MTAAQAAAYITGQAALLLVELEAMKAINAERTDQGKSLAYGEEAFIGLFSRYESVLGWNAALKLFQQCQEAGR